MTKSSFVFRDRDDLWPDSSVLIGVVMLIELGLTWMLA